MPHGYWFWCCMTYDPLLHCSGYGGQIFRNQSNRYPEAYVCMFIIHKWESPLTPHVYCCPHQVVSQGPLQTPCRMSDQMPVQASSCALGARDYLRNGTLRCFSTSARFENCLLTNAIAPCLDHSTSPFVGGCAASEIWSECPSRVKWIYRKGILW